MNAKQRTKVPMVQIELGVLLGETDALFGSSLSRRMKLRKNKVLLLKKGQ